MKTNHDGWHAGIMELDWNAGELREGLRCYRAAQFFDAHEHWETVWLSQSDAVRDFLQALIQVAAAFHHLQRGNVKGARSLLCRAQRRLSAYAPDFAGLDVASLREDIQWWIEVDEAEFSIDAKASSFPRIRLLSEATRQG